MAKKKSKSKKQKTSPPPQEDERVTLEALDAMSSSDDDSIPEGMLNTKAKNLLQAISDGKFDNVIKTLKENKDDDDEEIEEVSLGSDSDEEEDDDDEEERNQSKNDTVEQVSDSESGSEDDEDSQSNDSDDNEAEKKENKDSVEVMEADDDGESGEGSENDNEKSDSEDEEEEEGKDERQVDKRQQMEDNNLANSKALSAVTAEMIASHSHLPWPEKFDIVPPTPLPFGKKANKDDDDEEEEEEVVDIHDDLKREVAFYNTALEAVHEARKRCEKLKIPFSRPEDFFAEMVKTDDHMAKVKDKLIFETKKMEAVAQRKANREQKLRAKESQAHKLAEKAKRKKEHFKNVEEWANSAANNRGGALRDDLDDMYLNRAPGKKRQAADRKYGFGGKRGRFKQNDRATLNDVSGFNPKGNFPGMGMKKSAKGGAGANRQGKRARDAKRARRG